MWTCDVIEVMGAIEARFGHPICVESVRMNPWDNTIYVYLDDGSFYVYNFHAKTLDYFTGM